MRISSGGSQDINQLQSDAAQYRNRDFVVNNALAFALSTSSGPVAAQFSYVQLMNPVGSAVDVLVDKIFVSCTLTAGLSLRLFDTELVTDIGAWANLKSGSAAGLAHLRTQSSASVFGVSIFASRVLADTPWEFDIPFLFLLPPGTGLIARTATVNSQLFTSFTGREI